MDETSLSLLDRARAESSRDAWEQLAQSYTPLLHRWLTRLAVPPADADDLVQEILLVVVRELPRFQHAGRTGSFRAWLRNILVHRTRDYWRRQHARPPAVGGSSWNQQLDQLADDTSQLSVLWNREHDQQVMTRLLELVRPRFEPKTWDAFQRQAIAGQSADQVAAELGMTVGAVYVARSRVLRALRQEAAGLIEE